MKGLKKFLTGILAGALALTMTISAGTAMTAKAEGNGSITITNASKDQEYKVWRVFDYVAANEDAMAQGGIYKLSSKFSAFKSTYFTVGDGGILDTSKLATEADAAAFGQEVRAFAVEKNIAADGTGKATADGELKITGLEYGYYVVDTSLGSAVSVNTTTPNANIQEKNDVPSIDKKITGQINSGATEQKVLDTTGNNAQIGDTVEFTVTADLKKGGRNYKIVDTLTSGLTLNKDAANFTVTFEPATAAVSYNLDEAKDNGFKMSFGEPTADVKAIVKYTAVVNKDAQIASAAEKNTVYLEYGNSHTPEVETLTKTYPLVLKKIIAGAKSEAEEVVLAGAEFKVYRADGVSLVKFDKISDTEYKVNPAGTVDTIVTVETTPVTIKGLDAANYILEETKAPQGYNLLTSTAGGKAHAVQVTVAETSTIDNPQVEKIENSSGSILPSTGGIGTTIFYIIGGLLIVAAVVFFVVRRRADAE